ncbi:integral membrane protein [Verticillium alfalfae VaMs.102]|uniref:Integral membrane protein n=1 Tax=Verticillium alfalfae (strain VaMs.102 / ATCC MYA-4576 / FGSC 10136) TaxID=526221 RepID=C9SWI3_VERA1|nr:integral membrane protein [Verticillium alfalfae VaMs.102]EEY23148.1 integral membrane protein [Verticillium alfalfae VaMs.102]
MDPPPPYARRLLIALHNGLSRHVVSLPLGPSALAYCVASSALHVVVGSVFFDLVHCLAHHSGRSRNPLLRWLARSHIAHHQYFDRRLHFNPSFNRQNLLLHLPLELVCQAVGSLLSWQLTHVLFPHPQLQRQDLHLVLVFLTIRSGVVAWHEGRDSNHIAYTRLPKDPHAVLVGPEYHALHHVDPQGYFGSMVRLVDWLLGTATTLHGRRITITGARGALGRALADELGREKGRDGADGALRPRLDLRRLQRARAAAADDGHSGPRARRQGRRRPARQTATAPSPSFEGFSGARACLSPSSSSSSSSLLRPEVWYVGSEAELHGAWTDDMRAYTDAKRAFARCARAYCDDDDFTYRHVVPAAFSSAMGPALVSARWAAVVALWWIRRGARYVPVTYTGLAFLNFFRFYFWVTPSAVRKRT